MATGAQQKTGTGQTSPTGGTNSPPTHPNPNTATNRPTGTLPTYPQHSGNTLPPFNPNAGGATNAPGGPLAAPTPSLARLQAQTQVVAQQGANVAAGQPAAGAPAGGPTAVDTGKEHGPPLPPVPVPDPPTPDSPQVRQIGRWAQALPQPSSIAFPLIILFVFWVFIARYGGFSRFGWIYRLIQGKANIGSKSGGGTFSIADLARQVGQGQTPNVPGVPTGTSTTGTLGATGILGGVGDTNTQEQANFASSFRSRSNSSHTPTPDNAEAADGTYSRPTFNHVYSSSISMTSDN